MTERSCAHCGGSMAGKRPHAVYCSRSCKGKAAAKRQQARPEHQASERERGALRRVKPKYKTYQRDYQRAYYIRKRYGISLEQYEQLVAQPCFICGSNEKVRLDHDHSTGRIRSPLCDRCNLGLGCFRDNPETLKAAANYLRAHRVWARVVDKRAEEVQA